MVSYNKELYQLLSPRGILFEDLHLQIHSCELINNIYDLMRKVYDAQ